MLLPLPHTPPHRLLPHGHRLAHDERNVPGRIIWPSSLDDDDLLHHLGF